MSAATAVNGVAADSVLASVMVCLRSGAIRRTAAPAPQTCAEAAARPHSCRSPGTHVPDLSWVS